MSFDFRFDPPSGAELDDWIYICNGENCANCTFDCDDWEDYV
jgi:hypothetical protein